MSIFLLAVNKREVTQSKARRPPAAAEVIEYYSWAGQRVRLSVFTSATEPKPRIEDNSEYVFLVHGRSPNATVQNRSDLQSLNGNFNLVFIKKCDESLEFLKDFGNSLDAFFYEDENEIILTNNPLLIDTGGLALDEEGVAQYLLSYNGLWSQNYFLKGVQKIPRGSVLKIDSLQKPVTVNRRVFKPRIDMLTDQEFTTNFDSIVKVNARGLPVGEVTADLTGGYDSRLVVSCLLHNGAPFRAAVYGDGDQEVAFAGYMARRLHLPLEVVAITEQVPNFSRDWKRLFWLSGGSYNLFEVVKEGARAMLRAKGSKYRFAGGLGEVLRDVYYTDGLLRSRLRRDGLHASIEQKLISMRQQPFQWCSQMFRRRLEDFMVGFRESIKCDIAQDNSGLDETQLFMNAVFDRYVTGWLGTLYNFHGNMMTMIAPFVDCAFPSRCLNVNSDFRRHGSGVARATIAYWPSMGDIPYLSGQRSRPPQGLGLLDFYLSHYWLLGKRRMFGTQYKLDYNHAEWLRVLELDPEFREWAHSHTDRFSVIISDDAYKNLFSLAQAGNLDRIGFDFLWKLLSLKFTLENRW